MILNNSIMRKVSVLIIFLAFTSLKISAQGFSLVEFSFDINYNEAQDLNELKSILGDIIKKQSDIDNKLSTLSFYVENEDLLRAAKRVTDAHELLNNYAHSPKAYKAQINGWIKDLDTYVKDIKRDYDVSIRPEMINKMLRAAYVQDQYRLATKKIKSKDRKVQLETEFLDYFIGIDNYLDSIVRTQRQEIKDFLENTRVSYSKVCHGGSGASNNWHGWYIHEIKGGKIITSDNIDNRVDAANINLRLDTLNTIFLTVKNTTLKENGYEFKDKYRHLDSKIYWDRAKGQHRRCDGARADNGTNGRTLPQNIVNPEVTSRQTEYYKKLREFYNAALLQYNVQKAIAWIKSYS